MAILPFTQSEGRCNGVWTALALEKTYNRDAEPKLFTRISQQSTAMDKYLQALPTLTAVSLTDQGHGTPQSR